MHPGKLDIYAYGQLDIMETLIDVAVKRPCTESLQARAALQFGFAADVAEGEKLRDYRLPPGKVLTPFGVETFGRLGRCAEAFLQRLQTATTNRARLRGGHACSIVRRHREKIDAHLHRCAATACAQAEEGVGGVAPYRAMPAPMEVVIERLAPVPTRACQ